MSIYIIMNNSLNDTNGKLFAEVTESDKSFDYFIPSKKFNTLFQCPKCGYEQKVRDNIGKEVVEFDSRNIGDFTYGCTNIRYQFICSEKLLSILKEFKGIKNVKKVDVLISENDTFVDMNLYAIELHRSTNTISRLKSDLSNSIAVNRDVCSICNPDGKKYLTIDGIVLEELVNELDIFVLCEDSSLVFLSERLLEECKSKGVTNLIERCVLTKDYKYDVLDIKD